MRFLLIVFFYFTFHHKFDFVKCETKPFYPLGVGLEVPPIFVEKLEKREQQSQSNPCITSNNLNNKESSSTSVNIKNEENFSNNKQNGITSNLCPNSKRGGTFPTNYCNKYYNCWDGIVQQEQSCPDNLLFNIPSGFCDHPTNVDCTGRIIVEVLAPSPNFYKDNNFPSKTPPPMMNQNHSLKQKCFQSRGQFPSDKCNTFVNCWDDFAIEEKCPEGLLFSIKGYCDYLENVSCGSRLLEEDENQMKTKWNFFMF